MHTTARLARFIPVSGAPSPWVSFIMLINDLWQILDKEQINDRINHLRTQKTSQCTILRSLSMFQMKFPHLRQCTTRERGCEALVPLAWCGKKSDIFLTFPLFVSPIVLIFVHSLPSIRGSSLNVCFLALVPHYKACFEEASLEASTLTHRYSSFALTNMWEDICPWVISR